MKLSTIKNHLSVLNSIHFQLPDGSFVPEHFHITEVGVITKDFIDCGGKVRKEKVVNFQLWESVDFDHRLSPQKLIKIIELSEKVLRIEDLEIEVEYQSNTISKYGLEFDGKNFILTSKQTACLSPAMCINPDKKDKVNLSQLIDHKNNDTLKRKCC